MTDTDRPADTQRTGEAPQPTNRQILEALGSLATEVLSLRVAVDRALEALDSRHSCRVERALSILRAQERGNGAVRDDG